MTPQEAAALQAVAAAFDNRKPDAAAATMWSLALDGLRVEDCQQAIVAHYRTSTDWLMPATIRANVGRIRQQRLKEHAPVDPPASLDPDDVAGYLSWRRATGQRIADGEVIASAPAGSRSLEGMRALMPKPESVVVARGVRDPWPRRPPGCCPCRAGPVACVAG